MGLLGSWYYYEHSGDFLSAVVLTLFSAVVQSFALGFFFLISGFFTPGSYARKGSGAYLKGRFLRLGVPLLVYYFVINSLMCYVLYGVLEGKSINLVDSFGSGPLWFV